MCIQTHEIITIFVWNIAFTVTYSGQKVENIPQTHKIFLNHMKKISEGMKAVQEMALFSMIPAYIAVR